MSRKFTTANTAAPQTQLLASGDYSLMITAAGAGVSRWRDLDVTRWRADATCDAWGSFVLLRDADRGRMHSATWQPLVRCPDDYAASFDTGSARFARRDGDLACRMRIGIAAAGDGELRELELANHGSAARTLDVVSCAELVLASRGSDADHPAFSKMFVQTALEDDGQTLLAWRRQADDASRQPWAAHLCIVDGTDAIDSGFETDRAHFLGRGRDLRRPAVFDSGSPRKGRVGTVLDPIFSLTRRVRIEPGASVRLGFWTVVAETRDDVVAAAARCRKPAAAGQAFEATADAARQMLASARIDVASSDAVQRLTTPLFYADPAWRAGAGQLERARGGQSALWPHAISGDRPIVMVQLDAPDQIALVHELLAARAWWRAAHLAVDLVAINTAAGAAADALQKQLEALKDTADKETAEAAGALFVLRQDAIGQTGCDNIASAARVVLNAADGDLAEQVDQAATASAEHAAPRFADAARNMPGPPRKKPASPGTADPLEFFNGAGGFADQGREYRILLDAGQSTPMPWINVIANADFGFLVSADGGGYCWSVNSQKNQITPWSNDPVRDPPGEVLYLQDADSGDLWSATPRPLPGEGEWRVDHGHGYSRFAHRAFGIDMELVQFVAGDDPVKLSRLRLRNRSGHARRLRVTAFVHWALGAIGDEPAPFVITSRDASGALLARNAWRDDLPDTVVFADLNGKHRAWTCDRGEFLGRHGSLDRPAALSSDEPLGRRCGAGLDPCAALQREIELDDDAETEVVFALGQGADSAAARALIARYRNADIDALLDQARSHWDELFDAVQVRTPDRRLDLMVNRWLPYQVLSCRVHARAAFYQASGAWGFRDQLQDIMALCLSRPEVARAHLLRAAAHQFAEGDVMHWWLPPGGAGVRTRIVDDRLWLPLAVAHYVTTTGDTAVLDEQVAFLEAPALKPDQIDSFLKPAAADERASLFEHCARALEVSLKFGEHGLPLFGTGDWNDGMNRVGKEGRGESVWMGWFLLTVLAEFAPLADARGEDERARSWRDQAAELARSLDTHAWDGDWWLRGWYDDGSVLGSAASDECRIDTIAQSWAVMSHAADGQRAARAMASVERLAVDYKARLIALLTPAFDTGPKDPGYIKGYPPGLRENGGQYTHGVIWSVIAFAMLRDGDRAHALFDLLNPITHAEDASAVTRYQCEPYVTCGDIYTAPGHVGRGGWSWYSGSAGWLYRAALEWILGLRVQGSQMRLEPCIPKDWPGFEIKLRHGSARYRIRVDNPAGVSAGIVGAELDGQAIEPPAGAIPLVDDGSGHDVRITLG